MERCDVIDDDPHKNRPDAMRQQVSNRRVFRRVILFATSLCILVFTATMQRVLAQEGEPSPSTHAMRYDHKKIAPFTPDLQNLAEVHVYLPLIHQQIVPSPTATATPTATPTWQRIGSGVTDLTSVAWDAEQRKLLVGDLRESTGGIYERAIEDCNLDGAFTKVLGPIPILDISTSPGQAVAASFGGKVYYDFYDGLGWRATVSEMNPNVYSVARASSGKIFAGTDDGLYESTDAGVTWQHLGGPKLINEVAVYDDTVWISTNDTGVVTWSITGKSFTPDNVGLGGAGLTVWDVLIAADGKRFIGTQDGIYQQVDGTWTPIGGQGNTFYALLEYDGYLYAGGWNTGVLRVPMTNLDSNHWEALNEGTGWNPTMIVRDLMPIDLGVEGCQSGIVAATGDGVWILHLP